MRWGGGAWLTVPRRTGGGFSVVLADRKSGQKTIMARSALTPSCAARARCVGVGDIYVIAGQSNAVGVSDTLFRYSNPDAACRDVRKRPTHGVSCATRPIPRAARWTR